MQRWRRLPFAAIAMLIAFACSSNDPEPTPTPTPTPSAPATSPVGGGLVPPSPAAGPVLLDRNCDSFATQAEAQSFYVESGGPEQDIHDLDTDDNGRACDESATDASAASAATAPPQRAATTAPPAEAQRGETNSVSGEVDQPQGGSGRYESCEEDEGEEC